MLEGLDTIQPRGAVTCKNLQICPTVPPIHLLKAGHSLIVSVESAVQARPHAKNLYANGRTESRRRGIVARRGSCILINANAATQRGVPVDSKSEHPSPGLSRPAAVRVLVVEDFAAFREFVCLTLGDSPNFRVVGEASEGLEAIQKAVELRPDLILLDIGLPSLNGIEVARQMRSLVPESKIIFLTQESSADVVQEALSLGARGYVVKSNTEDLLAAVSAILSGMTFVSKAIGDRHFNFPTEAQLPY